jgi:hypothetical protein
MSSRRSSAAVGGEFAHAEIVEDEEGHGGEFRDPLAARAGERGVAELVEEEDRVLALGDEAAGGELEDEAAVHFLVEGEVKAVERLVGIAEVGLGEAAGEEAIGAAGELVLEEEGQEVGEREVLGLGLHEAGLETRRDAAERRRGRGAGARSA